MSKFLPILTCLIANFCNGETKMNNNYLATFECPHSINPISIENFIEKAEAERLRNRKNKTYWQQCLWPNYSCGRVRIFDQKYIFTCLSDYGSVTPTTFIQDPGGGGEWQVEFDDGDTLKLTKGCGFLENKMNAIERTVSTVTYDNLTFVTELMCCKGDVCSGPKWITVWDDSNNIREKQDNFWYLSLIFSPKLFCAIVIRVSLTSYQRLKERLLINALKTISTNIAEADNEDKSRKRSEFGGSVFLRIFKRGEKGKRNHLDSAKSDVTSSKPLLMEK